MVRIGECGFGVNISGGKVSGARVLVGRLGIMLDPIEKKGSWKDCAEKMKTP